ncbi:MAG: branched-chain amino acid ABC transporter permease [Alphaproteobacteria bacterium]
MNRSRVVKALALHGLIVALLFAAQFVVSDYNQLTLTRIMVLAVFAVGYNLLFGYTGLLSLGHALFFGAGLYGAGLAAYHLEASVPLAFLAGVGASLAVALVIGLISLRTRGVSFMIVTMMFAQAGFLALLYFNTWTGGDQGLTLPAAARSFAVGGLTVDLADPVVRYNLAVILLALALALVLLVVMRPGGRVLVAIRENEARTQMLGYDTFAHKLKAFVLSGGLSGASGAAYALMFAYVGSSFASIHYSIQALLFTLLGGAGTVLGPVLGTILMFYLIDKASDVTSAYLLVVGFVLIGLILWFPRGILGTIRERWVRWLP